MPFSSSPHPLMLLAIFLPWTRQSEIFNFPFSVWFNMGISLASCIISNHQSVMLSLFSYRFLQKCSLLRPELLSDLLPLLCSAVGISILQVRYQRSSPFINPSSRTTTPLHFCNKYYIGLKQGQLRLFGIHCVTKS